MLKVSTLRGEAPPSSAAYAAAPVRNDATAAATLFGLLMVLVRSDLFKDVEVLVAVWTE
ncbi:hypothetical protein [Nonomuraea sp. NPDC049646]|uniref:hypothetical protein n=1 Tax=unclassified Nonomuraea TaxID=2593643 RepID=UPI0037998D08